MFFIEKSPLPPGHEKETAASLEPYKAKAENAAREATSKADTLIGNKGLKPEKTPFAF